jgi:hypothetical protein
MERLFLKVKKAKTSKKKPSFHEGEEAKGKFERAMKTLFQVSKADSKKTPKGKD